MTEAKNSLTYDTFVRLRNSIIQGVIRPNERLIAADLASSMNISRTPVREALQLLEAEQLVISVKRGFVVREHSRSEIIEIYQVRAALEGMAAKLVAQQTSDSSIAAIEGIGAHLPELEESDNRSKVVDLNNAFHAAILQASGNQRLERINLSTSQQFFNYRIAELYTKDEQRASIKGHARIVLALRNHDAEEAEKAAQDHVLEGLHATLAKLR